MKIEIRTNKTIHYIDAKQIIYCKAERMYSSIYILNSKFILYSKPLKMLESILPTTNFCRIHKSYIININFLSQIKRRKNKDYVIINESIEIPIAKSKKTVLKKMVNQQNDTIQLGS